ncbi:hypothetical protein J132_09335 [Termitomyces sp. J132]|nr:hypothetical protein J132_09335 [Termitomyces sp. J132]
MRKSCLHSRRSSRSTGGKFAKIATKVASVRNARAFVERQWELARRGESIELKPSSLSLLTLQEEVMSGSSGGAKAKSKEWVESDEDSGDDSGNNNNNKVPLAQIRAASPVSVTSTKQPQMVTSEEGEGDVEMRETTLLATVTEVEWEASDMKVEGKEELEATPATIEEDKEEERAKEVEVQMGGLEQYSIAPVSLVDFDERVARVEWWFQRELEAAREELLVARAHYTVTKQTLVTLAGYWHDCQAFLAWQEENNIGEGD